MDPVLLARIQFAFTAGFHFIFPPITIGMAWLIAGMMVKWVRTDNPFWRDTARFWLKIFTATFAMGVATGITLEFQFGMNWADYSRFVGDIFGAPLAAEGIFSFFLESTFLGILLFGWSKVSKKTLAFASVMVAVGATLSAFWIIVANSWMQTPAGFEIQEGRAVLTDFWAALFNPSTMPRYIHTVIASITTGAYLMMGISAWYVLKKRHYIFAKESLKIGVIVSLVSSVLLLGAGHWHGVQVTKTQPAKLAAMEGHWETGTHAPMKLFGIVDEANERFLVTIEMPPLLSLIALGSADAKVIGLKDFPKDKRPPMTLPFYSFHLMVFMGMTFILFAMYGAYLLHRGTLCTSTGWLKLAVSATPVPVIANQLGWVTAEVGRQPWAVYNVIRTSDAVSLTVSAGEILLSLILFAGIYGMMFLLWIYLLRKIIRKGPAGVASSESEVTP